MTALVAVFVCVTIAVTALWLAPRLARRRVVFGTVPDRPRPFGYRMSWIAIRTSDTDTVMRSLGLSNPIVANWDSGVGTIYDDALSDTYIFITPPVRGWTFVCGLPLPQPISPAFADKLTPLLVGLSQVFGHVQYFAAFPIIDFFGWVRMQQGRMVRGFIIGDQGVIWDKGRLTPEEKALGLKFYDVRGIRGRKGDAGGAIVLYPTEDQVLRLAASWGLDPLLIDKSNAAPALGWIATAPVSWRSERIKRAA